MTAVKSGPAEVFIANRSSDGVVDRPPASLAVFVLLNDPGIRFGQARAEGNGRLPIQDALIIVLSLLRPATPRGAFRS